MYCLVLPFSDSVNIFSLVLVPLGYLDRAVVMYKMSPLGDFFIKAFLHNYGQTNRLLQRLDFSFLVFVYQHSHPLWDSS